LALAEIQFSMAIIKIFAVDAHKVIFCKKRAMPLMTVVAEFYFGGVDQNPQDLVEN
jgi:hypothetical protein